jgi:hypothetical protein
MAGSALVVGFDEGLDVGPDEVGFDDTLEAGVDTGGFDESGSWPDEAQPAAQGSTRSSIKAGQGWPGRKRVGRFTAS